MCIARNTSRLMKARSTVLQSSRWGVNLREMVGGGWWEECVHCIGEERGGVCASERRRGVCASERRGGVCASKRGGGGSVCIREERGSVCIGEERGRERKA